MRNDLARQFRKLTGRWRCLPDFLIIGAQKAGTTSLYAYLAQHPQMVCPERKEVLFFDRHMKRGIGYYRTFFPWRHAVNKVASKGRPRLITGEASPFYLQHPYCPKHIDDSIPDVRIIVVLRDPVERAWSQYRHNIRHNREDLSFEEALAAEASRAKSDLDALRTNPHHFPRTMMQYSYHHGGCYGTHLEKWFERFDRERVLILESERLFAETGETLNQVAAFLDIAPFPEIDVKPRNQGREMGQVADETVQELSRRFAPENAKLRELTGLPFRSW